MYAFNRELKGFDDTDFIETPLNESSNSQKYAYYAVYSKTGLKVLHLRDFFYFFYILAID